jgi:hypothetical protein
MFLDAAFADMQPQLQQFAANAFRPPEPIVQRHLLNQGHYRAGQRWFIAGMA